MSDRSSYEALCATVHWSVVEAGLGCKPGDPITIEWLCSDTTESLDRTASDIGHGGHPCFEE